MPASTDRWAACLAVTAVVVLLVGGCGSQTATPTAAPKPSTVPLAATTTSKAGTAATAPTTSTATSALAPPASKPPSPGPVVGRIGQIVSVDMDGQPAATITVSRLRTATVEPVQDGLPAEHGLYVVVDVTVKASADGFYIDPLDFYLLVGGRHFEETYADGFGPELAGATLNGGEHTTGALIFDTVPAGRHGKVVYAPSLVGKPVAAWTYS